MITEKQAKELVEEIEGVTSVREAAGNPNILGWFLFWVTSFGNDMDTPVWVDQEGNVHFHE
jgi:hypothetical protein